MKWAMIGTWRMALEGIENASKQLQIGETAGEALVSAIKQVEDFPFFKSVGYGGLPNEQGEVELDAAYMDGTSLSIGAVAGIKDFKNPIAIAQKLSQEYYNCFLVGSGAEAYAHKHGFLRYNMLSDRAKIHYQNRCKETLEKGLSPYAGHDTVGMIALDHTGHMVSGTSTSGLFMKRPGRVGDSPLSGSGFYVDSAIGGATATGLGEDIMKGCLSYEIVRLMKEGLSPQAAADKAVMDWTAHLVDRRGKAGDISVVCLNAKGEFGVATNIDNFSFVVASEDMKATVYLCKIQEGKTTYAPASKAWLEDYMKSRTAPLEAK